uniref:ETS domain-containing protein n=1 Tax=Meloidogyne hapla TaxID=6305 RepID=A0A1I8BP23_MELHA
MKQKCQRGVGHKENRNEYGKGDGEDEEEEDEEEEENEDGAIITSLNNFEIVVKSEQSFTTSQSDTELWDEEGEEEKNGDDEEKIEDVSQKSLQRVCKIEQNRIYQPQQEFCEDNNNLYLQGQQQQNDQTEIYRELILRHLIADITSTCAKLGLPTELALWSADDSRRWVAEMCTQFQIQIPPPESFVNLDGQRMLTLGVEEFQHRFPDGGDTLHAQLQLWKTAFESCGQQQQFFENQQINNQSRDWTNDNTLNSSSVAVLTGGSSTSPSSSSISSSTSASQQFNQCMSSRRQIPSIRAYQQQHYQVVHNYQGITQQQYYSNHRTLAQVGDEEQHLNYINTNNPAITTPSNYFVSENEKAVNAAALALFSNQTENCALLQKPNYHYNNQQQRQYLQQQNPRHHQRIIAAQNNNNSSGTIHLWHFIRELLDRPKEFEGCVRWVNREEGTFKIESSHHLARYWGIRKNRAAMNYDKLSRSLRQYYKKGIIQKPEKKQRLVYKFLPPYNH